METITLQCWVYRDDVENIFDVEISKDKAVGALKEIIRKKATEFRNVGAKDLRLYSIHIPWDDDECLKDKLEQLSLEDKQRLSSRTKISKLSPKSDEGEEELLIVVDGPSSREAEPLVAAALDTTVRYWVRGCLTSGPVLVKISSTENVAALKEAIKNKNALKFNSVDACDLVLYKLSLKRSKDDPLRGFPGAHTISSLGNPLEDSQMLSTIFMSPSADYQPHLIVDGLSLPLQCWIRGQGLGNSFSVQASINASIDDVKNAIKGACRQALSPNLLKLYLVPTEKVAEHLIAPGLGRLLQGNELVRRVFNDIPLSQRPCIVVELLDNACSPLPIPSTIHPRLQYLQAWARNPPKSPSQQGEASSFKDLQLTDRRIEWTRPPHSALTAPVTLLHPIFGQFIDDCHTHEPTSEDNSFVLDLSLQMSKFFENEGQRQEAFINILRSHRIGIMPSSGADYHTDGDVHVNGRRYMILEVKSEVGSKGAEPYCQAILYYIAGGKGEVEKASMMDVQFNFPCLIITLFGPHLSFSGAVWANRPHYQVLSTVLPLFWHPTDIMMRQCAARYIGAFLKAHQSLQELYKKFDQMPGDFQDFQPEFPHPRCYTSLEGKIQERFRYICALEAGKLLFIVKTDAGEHLCVKFVRTYAWIVHQQCAAWGVSPSLRGFDPIPGGWHMVVMDLLEGYECLYNVKRSLSHEEKERLREGLRSKLTDLHQMNLVHGDVRDANVMVRKDRLGWKLVDFDWSGKIGEVRYPMNMNRGRGLQRPEGALDGKLILADHDIKMLDYLFD